MINFSYSLWSFLTQRGSVSTQQFENAFGTLMFSNSNDDFYNEFRTARNILRLWHSMGWLEYDYDTQIVVPGKPTLVSYFEKTEQFISFVAIDRTNVEKIAETYNGSIITPDLDPSIADLYPPIYQMRFKVGMGPCIIANDLLNETPGVSDLISNKNGFGAEYEIVKIVNNIPKLPYLDGRRKFFYDTKDLSFKEGDPPRIGNFFTRYQSAYNFKTDCIWRQTSSTLPVEKQFRKIKEWSWGIHIALSESHGSPSTVMYDPVKMIFACYLATPLPRAISRLLAWHGGRPPGFRPNWFDPLRGKNYSLYLYHNVSHTMALSVASKLGFNPDIKPLRLIIL
jgi:hypothetical protein